MSGATGPDLAVSTREAFTAAVAGDRETCIEHLADIAGWGPRGVFTACWGWSAATLFGLTGHAEPEPGTYSLEIVHQVTGDTVSVDDAVPEPARQAALQLVTLCANRDADMVDAIVRAHIKRDGTGADLLMASVSLAAWAAKEHLQRHVATCDGCSDGRNARGGETS